MLGLWYNTFMPSLTDLSIAVNHYQTPEILRDCLARLGLYAAGAEIMVVDASSLDGTKAMMQRDFADIPFIVCKNYAMAQLVNEGIKASSKPYVCHMNADVMVTEKTFSELLRVLTHDAKVAMVAPVARNSAGRYQHQGLGYERHYRRLKKKSHASVAVPWLSGCIQVLKRSAIADVGAMDSRFRFYNEDMEWCFRLRRAGYSCQLVNTEVLHLGGSSTPKQAAFIVEGYRGGYLLSLGYKSKFYQRLHRLVVLAESSYKKHFSKDKIVKEAYSQIYEMFKRKDFSESPFGDSLLELNANFLADR